MGQEKGGGRVWDKRKVEEGYGTRERSDINIVHIAQNFIFMKGQLPKNYFWFLGYERVTALTDSPRLKAKQAVNAYFISSRSTRKTFVSTSSEFIQFLAARAGESPLRGKTMARPPSFLR